MALIPPASGRSDDPDVLVDLVAKPIAAARILDFVTGYPQLDGIVTFSSATRRGTEPGGKTIERLEYEPYRWLIDTLKKDVLVWKKGVFDDGEVRWVKPDGRQRNG